MWKNCEILSHMIYYSYESILGGFRNRGGGPEMTKKNSEGGEPLRLRAEKVDQGNNMQTMEQAQAFHVEDAERMLHELRVHQIELEMQNDELRRSHQDLEDSRVRYRELYDLAPVGYFTISEKGLITNRNLAFATLLGDTAKTLKNRPFAPLVFHEDQDAFYFWQKKIYETELSQVCELRMIKKSGLKIWVRLVANLAKNADGTMELRVALSDISEPKRISLELAEANRKIEDASRAKSVFLANMSHELRTPLNSIIGFSEVLKDKLFGPINAKQAVFVDNILNSGRHLLCLINDILDISKVEASKMVLDVGGINMEELCQGTVAMFSEKAREKQVMVSYLIDSSMKGVAVAADGRKVKQILYNLVDNAIKFNRSQGFVTIRVLMTAESLSTPLMKIVVEDNGVGIAEEDKDKLFLPFSQLAQSYFNKQTEGTGLGLALTKRLVELHGGTITLCSEFGKGSRFIILLPISQKELPKESRDGQNDSGC
jgi:PAS domain S-box-containing protein